MVKDENMKKCKKCNSEFNGMMIFHPELCLKCVLKIHIKQENVKETHHYDLIHFHG